MRVARALVLACVAVSLAVAAQAESRFGVMFGLNGSRPDGDLGRVLHGVLVAPGAGACYRQPLAAGWALRTGVELAKRGGTHSGPLVVIETPVFGVGDSTGAVTRIGNVKWTWYGTWLDVPLLAEKRFGHSPVQPYVVAGPELSWRIAGSSASDSSFVTGRVRTVSTAAVAGVGLAIHDRRSVITLEALARIGLSDALANGPAGRVQSLALRLVLNP